MSETDSFPTERSDVSNEAVLPDNPKSGEFSEQDIVMCHKYPDLECLDPLDCPLVYAKCWQYRIWNR